MSRNGSAPFWTTSVASVCLGLMVVEGIRMPNRWAVTQYLLGYDQGFIKRALWGETLRRTLGSWTASYFCLAAIALAVFALIVLFVARHARRLPHDADWAPFMLALSASPAIAFLAHLAGYLEQIGYLTLVLILAARRSWRLRVTAAALAAALLPLVHEASVFWVGALTLLALVVEPGAAAGRPPRLRLAILALVAGIWLVSTSSVLMFGRVSHEQAGALRDSRNTFFEIRPRQDAFQALTVSLGDSVRDMRRRWADPEVQIDMMSSLAVFGPSAVFLVMLAVRRAQSCDSSPIIQKTATALTGLAVLGPLVLHTVGWDLHRWNALATFNAGLAALTLLGAGGRPPEPEPDRPGRRPALLLAVGLAVAIWSVSADPVFFDGYGPSHPPFTRQILFLLKALRTGDPNIWIPDAGH